ncbi:MAG: hypothetical protein KAR03_09620, partial [Candidatus Thorarchaeota archaeon]|nr:hypothetical protein [Candidatus Thorarchaeota archaeon]
PDYYEIYQNGSLITTGTWNNTAAINYNLTNLQPGAYGYQVIVYDSSENSVSDTVLVVVEEPPDLVPLDIILIISIGSIGVIVIVIVVICRSRGQGASVDPGSGYQW